MAQSITDQDCVDNRSCTRRWQRRVVVLASLCLLLPIAVSIVWTVDRPLTDVEQRLVGTWRNTTSPAVFTFHADRTVTSPGLSRGIWRVHGNTLYTADSAFMEAVETLIRKHAAPPLELTFEDDNHISVMISINGGNHQWQRVSPQ